ncbi:MAG: tetratricopeptide repeat protein [bacterium]
MSRRLETLREQHSSNQTLTSLIELLEECKKEQLWDESIEAIDNWKGSETPEISFFKGVALLNKGEREKGAEELKKVIRNNPNHFAAKKEIENFGIYDEQDGGTVQGSSDALKKILVIEQNLEQNRHYRNVKYKNMFLLSLIVAILLFLAYFMLKENKADKYNRLLEHPEINFTSLTYSDYESKFRQLKIADIRENAGEPLKKCILWTSAFALLDFHIDSQEELAQFKMFSTLVSSKEKELAMIASYIESNTIPQGVELYHKLDIDYPDSINEIALLEITDPGKITKGNLREAFYKALMLLRKKEFSKAGELNERILAAFPDYELSLKLKIMIKAGSSISGNITLSNISNELTLLEQWKSASQERYFLGEARVLLGKASSNDKLISDGFYSVCPGRHFCKEIVEYFIDKGQTREASRMALFMKEQKENKRDADDIKLVIKSSYADGDYSNCYFSFRELAQFFDKDVDDETLMKGGKCSEKNGYFEEAVAIYEKINKKQQSIEITAKILMMKFRLSNEELFYTQIKDLAEKNPENISVLYSFLNVLTRKNSLKETVELLNKIYALEASENKLNTIKEYIAQGATFQAVKHLEQMKENKEASKALSDIYNRHFFFKAADGVLHKSITIDPLWIFFREQAELFKNKEYEIVSKEAEKKMSSLEKCEPALIFLKAESYRNLGDKHRTFAMIDALLECNPHYMPGLILAAEITFYQGDYIKAKDGIKYLLENENYLSPGKLCYHNYLVLLNAEIMVSEGLERKMISYLQKNLISTIPLGDKEIDKIADISEKLDSQKQRELDQLMRRLFKLSATAKEQ